MSLSMQALRLCKKRPVLAPGEAGIQQYVYVSVSCIKIWLAEYPSRSQLPYKSRSSLCVLAVCQFAYYFHSFYCFVSFSIAQLLPSTSR